MEISSKSQAENGTDNNTIMTPLRVKQSIAANASGGGGGTSDYTSLTNKPQINSITLDGNKTGVQLGLASSSDIPTKTSDLQNDSNFAVTNANNNFSATQRVNGTVYSEASYIEKGGGLGLRATGPVPGPVTNETGAITFYQWMEEEPDIYTEITKAKINVANVLDLTNCNPYYTAYDENGNQLVSSQLALMSNVPTKTSDLQNDTGYITGMTILTYGSSTWQNFLDAYNANRVVYCKASSGSNPGSGSKTRRAFLAYVNNETNPTEVEFQYYRSVSSHSATQQGDQVYVYKLNSSGTWSVTTREASSKVVAGTGLSSTYSGGTLTLSTASNNAVKDADNNFSAQQTFTGTKTSSPAGYTTDQYGNFHHQQATASDEWELYDYNGNIKARYLWESGNLKLNGSIEASGGYVAKEITNENILTLKPGLYYKEGSTGWAENGWPLATWHATLKVSGTAYDDNNGYRVLEVITTDNKVYRKTQSWNTWSDWEPIYSPFVLYTGDDNIGPITLSDSVANYDHIDIVYRSNDGTSYVSSKRVYDPNNKLVDLEYKYNLGTTLYTKWNKIGILGNQITLDTGFEYYWSTGTSSVNMATANNIYITKVVGYK